MSRAGGVCGSIPITSQLVEIEHMERIRWWVALVGCILARSVVLADDDFSWLVRGEGVDASQPPGSGEAEPTLAVTPFGETGSWRWAIYGGAAADVSNDAEHYNLHFSAEHFLAEYFSINLELGGLFFDQEEDTGGANFNILFRWHFLQGDDWTIYGDAGAGLLLAGEEVPDTGTNFNFTPQAGVGGTLGIGDDGARLMGGVRWHHISNARIKGEDHNPGRDSVMVYVGVSFPW